MKKKKDSNIYSIFKFIEWTFQTIKLYNNYTRKEGRLYYELHIRAE